MASKWLQIFLASSMVVVFVCIDVYFNYQDLTSPPLCKRDSCVNKDAANENCNRDAKTLVKQVVENIKVEFRYSKSCDAGWSRASAPPRSELYVQDTQGNKYGRYSVTFDTKAGDHFGDMGAGKQLRACVKLPDEGNHIICTEVPN